MIDTHLHLWDPSRFRYPWLADFTTLNRAATWTDYSAAGGGQIEGCVFVEADADSECALGEARWAFDLAADPSNDIVGVVASLRPEEATFPDKLAELAGNASLKGIRRVLHTAPDETSEGALFRENVRRLAAANLSFDLCALQRQLPLALDLVDACPDVRFILDHGGVPDIAANDPHEWMRSITALAERPNVFCKISGLLLYAAPEQRSVTGIQPWFEHLINSFGWDRVVWGGDWPVCELAVPLPNWIALTQELLLSASLSERDRLLSTNAQTIYNL